jgi:ribA/ribD-fused uncharacterized protein
MTMTQQDTTHVFFFQGALSMWHKAHFIEDGITFTSAKQHCMYHKAKLFNDDETADKILKANDPKTCKALGKKVHKFDMYYWTEHLAPIIFRGNYAKFSQNKRLYDMLINTSPALLVEASAFDNVLGIGLDEDTARNTPEHEWPGQNILGVVLTDLRDFFIKEELLTSQNKSL